MHLIHQKHQKKTQHYQLKYYVYRELLPKRTFKKEVNRLIPIIKLTKCVTTLGPSSNTAEVIQQLVENGSTCVRLNFSHGTHEEHLARIVTIREVSTKLNVPIAIMLDTRGPEIRTH